MKKGTVLLRIERKDVPDAHTIVHLIEDVERKLRERFPGAKITTIDATIERPASKSK